jgi:ComEC/Rec2-related protein
MQFHDLFIYTKVIFVCLLILFCLRLSFFYQTLSQQNLLPLQFRFYLGQWRQNCHYQAKGYLDFYLPNCHALPSGENYTIDGRVETVVDNVFVTYKNFDVKGIFLNSSFGTSDFFQFASLAHSFSQYWAKQRQTVRQWYYASFAKSPAQLALALSLGTSFIDLPQDLKQNFSALGLSHLIAVSGFHLNILSLLLFFGFAQLFSRRWTSFLVIIFLIWYSLLISTPASVVRAAFMLTFSLIGRVFFGRQVTPLYTFYLTFFLLVLTRVQFLFDLGFQLSFTATFGVLFAFPEFAQLDQLTSFDAWRDWTILVVREKSWLGQIGVRVGQAILLTLAVQLMTWPIIINTFGFFSFTSLVTIIIFSGLVAILITLVFIFFLLCLVFWPNSFFHQLIITPYAWTINFLLAVFQWLANQAAVFFGPPTAITWRLTWWQLAIYYTLLSVILYLFKRRRQYIDAYF